MNRGLQNRLPWDMIPIIVALAWPTMLEQLMNVAVQYIDTAMVGTLGTNATAAVGATGTVNWLINNTVSAIGIGFLSCVSQACGAENYEKARKAAAQAVTVTIVVGCALTALTLSLSSYVPIWMQADTAIAGLAGTYFFILYTPMLARTASIIFGTLLRAAGDTKTPMLVGIGMNITNVVLNYLLICPTRTVLVGKVPLLIPGAGWGVVGAGIASAIAYAVGGLFITVVFLRHRVISPMGYSMKPDWTLLKPCMKVALPYALQRCVTSLGNVAFASMINSLGEISTAAHTIANTVESAFYIPGYGMQTAAATLAGNCLGARDNHRLHKLAYMILLIEVALMILSGGLLFVFAPNMVRLFSKDVQVIALGSIVLRMVAVSEPFYGVSVVTEGMMQAMGKTMMPFVSNIICMWGIRILGTLMCTQMLGLGLVSAWACMIAHNLTMFTLFLIYIVTGKWNPMGKLKYSCIK